ncbi:MAG TPA: hypothetical protein VMT24_01065 [Aggregatilineaceae bacterium]|nr:hypothetical protein [Aggregatilineaceae bacterium]
MKKTLRWAVIVMLGLTFVPARAQGGEWRVTAARAMEVDNVIVSHILMAPDGVHLAYERRDEQGNNRKLCTRLVTFALETCLDLPEGFPTGLLPEAYFQSITWSPDSTKLAVVGNPLRFLVDTDLWIVDLSQRTLTNLTDDHYQGKLFPPDQSMAGASVEIQPTWSPDSQRIAVERTILDQTGNFGQSTISIIEVATGEIRDVTLLPGHEVYQRDVGSVLSMSWLPDQSALALALRHVKLEPDYDGIWQVSVSDGKLQQLVRVADALPAFNSVAGEAEIFAVGPASWSPDGSSLLFWMGDPGSLAGVVWGFWLDVKSGAIEPFPLPEGSGASQGRPPVSPLQAVWSPDGMLLVAERYLNAPGDSTPTYLDPANPSLDVGIRLIDTATGQATLLGYLPAIPAAPFAAVWGPENDVLLDGYHLILANG